MMFQNVFLLIIMIYLFYYKYTNNFESSTFILTLKGKPIWHSGLYLLFYFNSPFQKLQNNLNSNYLSEICMLSKQKKSRNSKTTTKIVPGR